MRRTVLKAMVVGTVIAVNCRALAISIENQKENRNEMKETVIISFDVKIDKIVEFTKILDSVKVDLPKIEGCIGVSVFKNSTQANHFVLVETWASRALHQAHVGNLSKEGTWSMIRSHLSKDPESDYFIPL